jgi:hypothetical protein
MYAILKIVSGIVNQILNKKNKGIKLKRIQNSGMYIQTREYIMKFTGAYPPRTMNALNGIIPIGAMSEMRIIKNAMTPGLVPYNS